MFTVGYMSFFSSLYLFFLLQARTTSRRVLSALSLSTFPVLYFFNFLYYTDAGSTFFILFAYLMTLYSCHKASAFLGICAILFRQTNVVWVALCAATVAAARMDETWRAEHSKKKDEKPQLSQLPLSWSEWKKLLHFVLNFLTQPTHIKAVLLVAWPYAVVGAGFLVFVVLNGGIVVGDRTSHEAVPHFPQLFYFFSFTLVFSFPISLCYQRTQRFLQTLRRQPLFFLLLSVASLFVVWKCTFIHRYLLADNRHYTFYVWRRLLQRHELVPYALVPVYIFAAWNFFDSMKSRSLFWSLGFLVCLLAATVPQKLLEFRYFIVPYLMYRLHMPLPSLHRLALELLLYTLVNTATLYIFITKTFQWPHNSDTQRFMW